MEDARINKILKWFFARVICYPAFLMPYRIRVAYIQFLSVVIHVPFRIFGKLAHFLLDQLNIVPISGENLAVSSASASASEKERQALMQIQEGDSIALLYSGGTDSTCVAALMAPHFKEIHLLTFYEYATRNSPLPQKNIELLKKHFPQTKWNHHVFGIDDLVKRFSYEHYLKNIWKHGLCALSTCGYSTLSWHVQALRYCRENKIQTVADGLTKELMHFPGHMDEVVSLIQEFYSRYGIQYQNPVRQWPTPVDQQFVDRLLVNRHTGEFFPGDLHPAQRKTTGKYLFDLGIFPSENIKGSKFDFLMQHDCYPFALYNLIAFWGYLTVESYAHFCQRVMHLMSDKIQDAHRLIENETQRVALL